MGGRGGTSARAREWGSSRREPASQVAARDGMRRKAKRALRKFERKKDGENARVPSRSVLGCGQSVNLVRSPDFELSLLLMPLCHSVLSCICGTGTDREYYT